MLNFLDEPQVQPDIEIAGFRPPARAPRTPKGQQRMREVDFVENIQREWDNRNRPKKRSKFLYDGNPQTFDKVTSDFLDELEGVRDQAITSSEPPVELRGAKTEADIEAGQEYFRVKEETKNMSDDPSMRLYNLGPTLYPKQFQQMRDYIFRGLDTKVESSMKNAGLSHSEALDRLKRSSVPASMGGTNNKARSQLANDLLYEYKTIRRREAADKTQGVMEGLPAYSAPLDQDEPGLGSLMTPGA